MAVTTPTRTQIELTPEWVAAVCYYSHLYSAAAVVTREDLTRAAEVLKELVHRGVTALPFGVVLDWTMLIDREWDFPFRSLAPKAESGHVRLPLPTNYENDVLNPYLLSPHLRRVREILLLRGKSVPRMAHWLEHLATGLDEFVPFVVSHYDVIPSKLADMLELFATGQLLLAPVDHSADLVPAHEAVEARFPGLVPALHEATADFLRQRLSVDPVAAGAAIQPVRLSDIDLYELEHVEIFISKATRLRSRQLGLVDQLLGAPNTRGLIRHVEVPEVVVNRDDESHYPAGGVAELTTTGSFENLVPSELMYLEDEPREIDIFSLKHVENELLFFVRDAGLLVRRRRRIHLCVWDVPAFRFKFRHQTYNMEVYLDGLLVRLIRDLFTFFEGEGLSLTAHWMLGNITRRFDQPFDKAIRNTPGRKRQGESGSDDREARDVFDLLFKAEREKRLAEFLYHGDSEMVREYLKAHDHPLNQWLILMPPVESQGVATSSKQRVALLQPTWLEMMQRGGRPATLVTWNTMGTSRRPVAFAHPAIPAFPNVTALNLGELDGIREFEFAFPADAADPIPALRNLRQFLLTLLVTFV